MIKIYITNKKGNYPQKTKKALLLTSVLRNGGLSASYQTF